MKTRYYIVAKCYNKKGRLLSVGTNSYTRTHPVQKSLAERAGLQGKEFLHAEIAAILRAKDSKIHRIVVERYGKNGFPLLAKPCPVCYTAIYQWGIREVWHTVTGSLTLHKEVVA